MDVKVFGSDRYLTYRTFKNEFGFEVYLNDISLKRFRDTIIRFRLGLNELGVNKRFQTGNVDIKNCPFCQGILEDEKHLLFTCHMYQDLRHKYLPHLINLDRQSLDIALNTPCVESIRKVAMFLFYSLKKREDQIRA